MPMTPHEARRHGITRRATARLLLSLALMVPVLLAALPAGTRAATGGPVPVAAEVAPQDALFFLGASLDPTTPAFQSMLDLLIQGDFNVTLGDVAGSAAGSLSGASMIDPAIVAALIGSEIGVVATGIAHDLGARVTDVVGGDGTAALDPSSLADAVVAIRPLTPDIAWTTFQATFAADAEAAGATVTSVDVGGVQVETFSGTDADGMPVRSALARSGDYLLVAAAPEDMLPVLETLAGTRQSLADGELFPELVASLPADALAYGYVNGSVVGTEAAEATSSMVALPSLTGIAGASRQIGFAASASPDGLKVDTVEVAIDGSTIDPRPYDGPLDIAGSVPADAMLFVNGSGLGSSAAIRIVEVVIASLLGAIAGGGSGTPTAIPDIAGFIDEQFASAELLLGFNIGSGFLDLLEGQYGFALSGVDLSDPTGIRAILVSDVASPEVVSDSLGKLAFVIQALGTGQASVSTTTVNGSTVTIVSLDLGLGLPVIVEYGVVNGRFMLGIGPVIEEIAAGSSTSLADNPEYQRALAALPTGYDGVFWVDLSQVDTLLAGSGSISMGGDRSTPDRNPRCSSWTGQAAAQAAYDNDPVAEFDLDEDYDGLACEDFFAEASPVAVEAPSASALSSFSSLATVSWRADGKAYTSTIVLLDEQP